MCVWGGGRAAVLHLMPPLRPRAQGFAYACNALGMSGVVYMPTCTPAQKVTQTRMWGEARVEVRLVGASFDDAAAAAREFAVAEGRVFVPPFDDWRIIEGQGTIAAEILADLPAPDFVFMPVGGGGLASGVGLMMRGLGSGGRPTGATTESRAAQLVGLEPAGAPSMMAALRAGAPVSLGSIDTFVDGAAVKRVGDLTHAAVAATLDVMHTVPEGRVCTTGARRGAALRGCACACWRRALDALRAAPRRRAVLDLYAPRRRAVLDLYNKEGMVVEPAGALSVSALDDFAFAIRGKKVVCVISGSNADVCAALARVAGGGWAHHARSDVPAAGVRRARAPGTACRRSRSGR